MISEYDDDAFNDDISDDALTTEADEEDEAEEDRKALENFRNTGVINVGKLKKKRIQHEDGTWEDIIVDPAQEFFDKFRDPWGLRYFHRVAQVTAETTDVPLVEPATEQDVEDLMLLDVLRISLGIFDEMDAPQFRHVKVKLDTVRRAGLDDGLIFNDPREYSNLDEYYNIDFLNTTPFIKEDYEDDEDEEVYDEYFSPIMKSLNIPFVAEIEDDSSDDETEYTMNFTDTEDEYDGLVPYEDGMPRRRRMITPGDAAMNLEITSKRKSRVLWCVCGVAEIINRCVGIPYHASSEIVIPEFLNNCFTSEDVEQEVVSTTKKQTLPISKAKQSTEVIYDTTRNITGRIVD